MRKYLYFAVFSAGMVTLAAELSASRLLGNYFGSSNLVWAAIIGLILIYLSIGYAIGGRWADRSPKIETFLKILLWAGLFVGLIPLISRPILRLASTAFDELRTGIMIGTFISVLLLFCIPVTLLGTASPFAIRLALGEKADAGKTAGRIYALSTIGSFVGTFIPDLLLIPLIGTYRTFIILGLSLITISLICMWALLGSKKTTKFLWMPIILIVLIIFGVQGFDKSAKGLIYEKESAYNYIQVLEINGFHVLRLNEGQGIHSIYHPSQENYFGYWEQILSAPFFNPAPVSPDDIERIAILGLAGGTSALQAKKVFPNAIIDGYEIDPDIIQAGFEYFNLTPETVNIHIEDARRGIQHNPHYYQIINIDAYTPPYIPWHLTTREFFTEVFNHLTTDGIMAINVARIYEDRRLVDALFTTINSVFTNTYIVDIPDTFNSMIFATKSPTNPSNLIDNYILLESNPSVHPLLLSALEITVLNTQPIPEETIIFTDDRAPVEWLTNAMIFNFFSPENIERLQ